MTKAKMNAKRGFVWRVYDILNNGRIIREFKTERSAVDFAHKKSIYYEVRKVKVILFELS